MRASGNKTKLQVVPNYDSCGTSAPKMVKAAAVASQSVDTTPQSAYNMSLMCGGQTLSTARPGEPFVIDESYRNATSCKVKVMPLDSANSDVAESEVDLGYDMSEVFDAAEAKKSPTSTKATIPSFFYKAKTSSGYVNQFGDSINVASGQTVRMAFTLPDGVIMSGFDMDGDGAWSINAAQNISCDFAAKPVLCQYDLALPQGVVGTRQPVFNYLNKDDGEYYNLYGPKLQIVPAGSQVPVVSLSASPTVAAVGETVKFAGSVAGDYTSLKWGLVNSAGSAAWKNATSLNASLTMTQAGTYTAKLRACNAQDLCGEGMIGVCVGSQCKVTNPFNAMTDQNYQASAITAPTQGAKLKSGEMATATWDKTKLAGKTVYLYILKDDPIKLVDGNATSFKNAQWYLFASVANTGSTTFDPALMQATGNAYRLLVVDETGRWAVSTGLFSVNATTPPIVSATGKLNDTGIVTCGTPSTAATQSNSLDCTDPAAATPAQQDGMNGRDYAAQQGTLTKVGGSTPNNGKANGFDFTKIGSNGQPLAIQNGTWNAGGSEAAGTKWDCVLDNVTGLLWENKSDNATPDLRDKDWIYTWYNSNPATNGGNAGTVSGGSCFQSGRCDTEKFVADVNAAGLCGHTDWRMPSLGELQGIADLGRVNPVIDSGYFPSTLSDYYWSASPFAANTDFAWFVSFYYGNAYGFNKGSNNSVRLVRGQ